MPSSETSSSETSAASVVPSNANVLAANAAQNTAGGKIEEANIMDALRTIKSSDFKDVHKKPCVRDALLTGIGGGFGIGGARVIWGGTIVVVAFPAFKVRLIITASVWSSCNWAVGSFVFGSFLMHEFCQRKRTMEKQGMKRAVEVLDRKHMEKQKKIDEATAARRKVQKDTDAEA